MAAVISMPELKAFHDQICQYEFPEELFGVLTGSHEEKEREVTRLFRIWMAKYHVDLFNSKPEVLRHLAEEITRTINQFRDEAVKGIRENRYGAAVRKRRQNSLYEVSSGTRAYRVLAKLAAGTVADVFLAEYDIDGGVDHVCLKVVRDPADNNLMGNEWEILVAVKHKSLPTWHKTFVDSEHRVVTVLKYIDDGYDFISLREMERYKNGVPQEHGAWILQRSLSVLGYLHSQMVVKGNVEPSGCLVRVSNHNVFQIGFAFALRNPSARQHIGCITEPYSAPEVYRKARPLPTADIFGLGRSMMYLLGGDPESDYLPPSVDIRFANFLRSMTISDYYSRPGDAWELYPHWRDLRKQILGEETFLPFEV